MYPGSPTRTYSCILAMEYWGYNEIIKCVSSFPLLLSIFLTLLSSPPPLLSFPSPLFSSPLPSHCHSLLLLSLFPSPLLAPLSLPFPNHVLPTYSHGERVAKSRLHRKVLLGPMPENSTVALCPLIVTPLLMRCTVHIS